MAANEIVLQSNHLANVGIGSFAVINAVILPDGSPEVHLVVKTDDEYEFTLHPDDVFPVQGQIWKLDKVVNPGTGDWTVVLIRVQ